MFNKFLKASLWLICLASLTLHGGNGADQGCDRSKCWEFSKYLSGCGTLALSVASLHYQRVASHYCYPGSPDWNVNYDDISYCSTIDLLESANQKSFYYAIASTTISAYMNALATYPLFRDGCCSEDDTDCSRWSKLLKRGKKIWPGIAFILADVEWFKAIIGLTKSSSEWSPDPLGTTLLSIVAADAIWTIGSPLFIKAGKMIWNSFAHKTPPCHSTSETDWVRNPLQRTERTGNLPVTQSAP